MTRHGTPSFQYFKQTCRLNRSSGVVQPTLSEVTYRLYSSQVVRVGHGTPEFSLGRFARLIENMGDERLDD